MSDLLDELDSLATKEPVKVTKKAEKKKPVVDSIISGVDYNNLSNVMKNEALYAVKNTSGKDLVIDWDLDLMPEELKGEFKKYLNDKYVQYQLDKISKEITLVAVKVQGRTINFLHNFMTDKQVPSIVRVYEGGEAVVKSQFVIPDDATVICTATQINSLDRYRKYKIEGEDNKLSDWVGFLAVKELSTDSLKKVKYSMVTVSDIKSAAFEAAPEEVAPVRSRAARTIESDDLSDL